MGKIITIASQKGGVGKTTITLNLGYALSRLAGRVLMVDLDPQGGLTIATNIKKKTTKGIIDLLKNQAQPDEVIAESRDGVIGVVGTGQMEPDDVFLFESAAWHGELGQALSKLSTGYQYTIIDAPAGVGSILRSALTAGEGVILVINCRSISLKSLPTFLKLVQQIADGKNPKLKLEGVLLSMVDERSPSEMQMAEEIRKAMPKEIFFRTTIPMDERFEVASIHAIPLAMHPEAQNLAHSFFELAMEIKEREMNDRSPSGSHEIGSGLF